MDLSYWLIQNEASGNCDEQSRISADSTDYWWTVLIPVAIIQACYICYVCYRYQLSENLKIEARWVIVVYLLLHCTCSLGYFLYILAPLYFYFYKFMFQIVSLLQYLHIAGGDKVLKRYAGGFRGVLPGKWISRDVQSAFAFLYFLTCMCLDVMWLGIAEVMTGQYLIGLFGRWTTSAVILLSLASLMSTVSNCTLAVSRYIVTGNVNFMEVFDVNAGHPVFISMIVTSIQAGILSGPFYHRSENLAFVLLLLMFSIVCQLWDLSEQHFLFLLNSGETRQKWVYLRIIYFMIIIVSGPTYLVYYLSNTYQLYFWPLLNMTGVTRLVSRVILSIIEFSLIAVSWRVEDKKDRLADAIYYTRVTKSIAGIVCLALTLYWRLYSPYFEGPFLFNLSVNLFEFVCITVIISFKEWLEFQNRRRLVQLFDRIPEATPDEILQYDDVCSICYNAIERGKILPCGHIFHANCLRKWFQVRRTCPFCNSVVQNQ